MPKGDKAKKIKKRNLQTKVTSNQELVLRDEMEEYAKVTKTCGDCKLMVSLPDSTSVMARIPGKFHRKNIIRVGDVVLVSKRDYQVSMVDILHKYDHEDIKTLYNIKEIPGVFLTGEEDTTDTGIVMVEDGDQDQDVDLDKI